MKKYLTILYLLVSGVIFQACSDVELGNLQGNWYECYNDPGFCMDSSVNYKFEGSETAGTVIVTSYSYLGGPEIEKPYVLQGEYTIKNDVISVRFQGDSKITRYKVVKLNRNEMEWQMEGTKFSKNQYSSEYKHFSRE